MTLLSSVDLHVLHKKKLAYNYWLYISILIPNLFFFRFIYLVCQDHVEWILSIYYRRQMLELSISICRYLVKYIQSITHGCKVCKYIQYSEYICRYNLPSRVNLAAEPQPFMILFFLTDHRATDFTLSKICGTETKNSSHLSTLIFTTKRFVRAVSCG